jgi:heme/copper-type cytochrome/quinol oxidase subunit 4
MQQGWHKYLRDVRLFVGVGVVLVLASIAVVMFLDDIFEGEVPYFLRLALAFIFILIGVIAFSRMTGKSYRDLKPKKSIKPDSTDH